MENEIKPVRIQRSRKHLQVSPNGLDIVYCGRPSRFGNPFKVGDLIKIGNGKCKGEYGYLKCLYEEYNDGTFRKLKTVIDVVNAYKEYITKYPYNYLYELKGKNLSCWCKIGEPCHADILLEIANK